MVIRPCFLFFIIQKHANCIKNCVFCIIFKVQDRLKTLGLQDTFAHPQMADLPHGQLSQMPDVAASGVTHVSGLFRKACLSCMVDVNAIRPVLFL